MMMPTAGAVAHDRVDAAMRLIVTAIEVVGVGVIVIGALLASARYLRRGFGLHSWNEGRREIERPLVTTTARTAAAGGAKIEFIEAFTVPVLVTHAMVIEA